MTLTTISGVPDRGSVLPGMAFFAGTGPTGKTCGDCKFRVDRRCDVARRLAGKQYPTIKKDYAACKYFEAEPK